MTQFTRFNEYVCKLIHKPMFFSMVICNTNKDNWMIINNYIKTILKPTVVLFDESKYISL